MPNRRRTTGRPPKFTDRSILVPDIDQAESTTRGLVGQGGQYANDHRQLNSRYWQRGVAWLRAAQRDIGILPATTGRVSPELEVDPCW